MYQYESQIATTTQIAQDIGGDALTTVSVVIGIVLGIAVFMVGVAFAWRKIRRYVTGNKF